MKKVDIAVMEEDDVSPEQKNEMLRLQIACFSNQVTAEEVEEDFNRPPVARVSANHQNKIIACAEVFKRKVEYDGQTIVIGGMGPCTRSRILVGLSKQRVAVQPRHAARPPCDSCQAFIRLCVIADQPPLVLGFYPFPLGKRRMQGIDPGALLSRGAAHQLQDGDHDKACMGDRGDRLPGVGQGDGLLRCYHTCHELLPILAPRRERTGWLSVR